MKLLHYLKNSNYLEQNLKFNFRWVTFSYPFLFFYKRLIISNKKIILKNI